MSRVRLLGGVRHASFRGNEHRRPPRFALSPKSTSVGGGGRPFVLRRRNKTTDGGATPPRKNNNNNNNHKSVDGDGSAAAPYHERLSSASVVARSSVVGATAGFCGSLAGMGGGFLMVPAMTSSLLRLPQAVAHGTSLCAVCAVGAAGAAGYGTDDVSLETAAIVAVTGAASARYGASATTRFSARTLRTLFGAFTLAAAPVVPLKARLAREHGADAAATKTNDDDLVARLVVPGVAGLGAGFAAGLFGVGGGLVTVPALTVATDMSHKEALGTSLCAMVLPALSGTVTHVRNGNVVTRVAAPLAISAFAGGYLGGRCGSTAVSEDQLRWGFSALLTVLGAKTLSGALRR